MLQSTKTDDTPLKEGNKLMKTNILFGAALLLLVGCTSSPQQQQPVAQKDQGRPETKKIEAATAVGYDGAAIRKNVDNTLNKNDDHLKETDKQSAETK
jgi:hypothetical protein